MRYYRLAARSVYLDPGFQVTWAVDICFEPVDPSRAIHLCEVPAWKREVSPAAALTPLWSRHFDNAGGTWLRPYLERMAAGEQGPAREAIDHFVRKYGWEPETYDISERA